MTATATKGTTYAGRLAARVRQLRKNKPVVDVAKAIGVAPVTLYQYESGRREIPVSIVVALAGVYGKRPGDVFPKE